MLFSLPFDVNDESGDISLRSWAYMDFLSKTFYRGWCFKNIPVRSCFVYSTLLSCLIISKWFVLENSLLPCLILVKNLYNGIRIHLTSKITLEEFNVKSWMKRRYSRFLFSDLFLRKLVRAVYYPLCRLSRSLNKVRARAQIIFRVFMDSTLCSSSI